MSKTGNMKYIGIKKELFLISSTAVMLHKSLRLSD